MLEVRSQRVRDRLHDASGSGVRISIGPGLRFVEMRPSRYVSGTDARRFHDLTSLTLLGAEPIYHRADVEASIENAVAG